MAIYRVLGGQNSILLEADSLEEATRLGRSFVDSEAQVLPAIKKTITVDVYGIDDREVQTGIDAVKSLAYAWTWTVRVHGRVLRYRW